MVAQPFGVGTRAMPTRCITVVAIRGSFPSRTVLSLSVN